MVTNSRAPARAGAIKPLNAPQPVSVRTDERGAPVAVQIKPPAARGSGRPRRQRNAPAARLKGIRSDGAWIAVSEVENRWKVNEGWWRGPDEEIERMYFVLLLEGGQTATIFQDMVSGEWRRQAD